jgi:hypothetical protein
MNEGSRKAVQEFRKEEEDSWGEEKKDGSPPRMQEQQHESLVTIGGNDFRLSVRGVRDKKTVPPFIIPAPLHLFVVVVVVTPLLTPTQTTLARCVALFWNCHPTWSKS